MTMGTRIQTPHRAPTASTGKADAYGETLDRVHADLFTLLTAMVGARRARPARRAAALADLHHRVRTIAAVLNHALGGWPEPDDGPPQ